MTEKTNYHLDCDKIDEALVPVTEKMFKKNIEHLVKRYADLADIPSTLDIIRRCLKKEDVMFTIKRYEKLDYNGKRTLPFSIFDGFRNFRIINDVGVEIKEVKLYECGLEEPVLTVKPNADLSFSFNISGSLWSRIFDKRVCLQVVSTDELFRGTLDELCAITYDAIYFTKGYREQYKQTASKFVY